MVSNGNGNLHYLYPGKLLQGTQVTNGPSMLLGQGELQNA